MPLKQLRGWCTFCASVRMKVTLRKDICLPLSLNVDFGTSATLITFGGYDLVVVLPKVHAVAGPGVEVILHVYAATDTLSSANRPVLLEGPCAIDRRLVGAGRDGNVVGTTVGLEATLALSTAAGVVGTVRFDHVVLHKRVASPAVHREVAITLRVERATVIDSP
jgi:hypothetical protein